MAKEKEVFLLGNVSIIILHALYWLFTGVCLSFAEDEEGKGSCACTGDTLLIGAAGRVAFIKAVACCIDAPQE